jgi:hypothetical protein
VSAKCPIGTRVVGGGGWTRAVAAADQAKVILRQLAPNYTEYIVTGIEVDPGTAGNWWVEAYALCASEPAGYEIVLASSTPSSSAVQQIAAVCPAGKRVIGTGAQINSWELLTQVTLQLVRSSGPRDIVRATAKEDANGYTGNWVVSAFAICANPLAGITVEYFGPTYRWSENSKVEEVDCPSGTHAHNTGAATSGEPPGLDTTPPGVAIQMLYPLNSLTVVRVAAVETTPTNADWHLVAQTICGPP